MPMQQYIDIAWEFVRRDMLKAKSQSVAHKIDNQWPLEIAVAISTHDSQFRSNRAQFVENRFRANVAKVPYFIGIFRNLLHFSR